MRQTATPLFNRALLLVWATYAASVPMLYLQAKLHNQPLSALFGGLLLLTLFGVVPYFLSMRKNWARHLFAAEVGLSVVTLALGFQEPALTPLEQGMYWFIEIFELVAVWLLYRPEVVALFRPGQSPRLALPAQGVPKKTAPGGAVVEK